MGNKDLSGMRIGKLIVLERYCKDKRNNWLWLCKCDCNNMALVTTYRLTHEITKSCGCLSKEVHSIHGKSQTRLFRIWIEMNRRTRDFTRNTAKYYAEKGIEVCKAWRESFKEFEKWSLENGYSEYLTIDRIDNDKGYSPENCRWVTHKVQSRNKSNNTYIVFGGQSKTLAEWGEESHISSDTISKRLKNGWSVEKALTTPTRKKKNKILNTKGTH